jgi:NodT family efflux transporter outer membrane factor (OMF) lipoprotein
MAPHTHPHRFRSSFLEHALRLILPVGAAMLMSACGSLHSVYQKPAADIPAQFSYATTNITTNTTTNADGDDAAAVPASTSAENTQAWWKNFGDPQLDRLIDTALRRNNDLAAAAIRVRRAQLLAGIAADQLLPQAGINANVGFSRSLQGAGKGRRSSAAVNARVSYELDLWGRLDSLNDAAQWEALATEQDRASAALTLIGTTAALYWQAAYLNRRMMLSEQSIAYAEQINSLVQVQYRAGAVSSLAFQEARQNMAAQRAAQTQLRQQQVENDNALAILLDGPPQSMPGLLQRQQPQPQPWSLPDIALPAPVADVPAAVLARRPDLRAAQFRLRSTLAGVDATRASYYPQFSLTGSAGSSSDSLRTLLQNPVAGLGLGLVLPFLQWDQMQRNIQVAQADYAFAVHNFRQSLYSALRDVEDALSAREQYAKQAALLTQNLDAARVAERLYGIRYRSGAVALRQFLDAQEKRRGAEIAVARNRLDALNNQMTLYRALGGSDLPDSP